MPKLTRKTQKIFCENANNEQLAVFGSMMTGTPIYTNDVEILQGSEAYSEGWDAATLEDKAPFMEEMNGLQYGLSKQIAYTFQEGIPEYDANTTYYIGSIVKALNEGKPILYTSIIDENIGNDLFDSTSWEELKIGGSGHDLFDIVFKDHVLTFTESSGFAQLGTYVYKTAVAGSRYGYPTFYAQCLKEYQEAVADGIYFKHENGHVFYDIANKAEVDATYNSTGIAWAYGIDTANERIFLPRNDYYFKNGSADDVGKTIEEELPNIKASFNTSLMTSGLAQATSGAASATQISSNNKGGTGHTFTEYKIDINASNSDATYKDGGEVIPKSVSMIPYMVVGNTANEEALTDVIDITTTENDTLPLFYNTYSDQDMTSTGAFVNASLGNYLDGNVWTTAYAEIEKMGIGAKFGAGSIKAYGDSSITDFDLVLNQSNMTFRLPLLNGGEDLPSDRYDELSLTASDTEYTAPANGWYYVYKEALTANEYLTLQNKTSGKAEIIYAQEAYNQCRVSIDAKKGDIVNIGYSLTSTTTKACRFIYAQGNGSLYYKLDNVLQNAQLLDVAGVTSALNNKVSVDNLVEITPAFCMPSDTYVDLTLGATGTTYTAPATGWVLIDKQTSSGKNIVLWNLTKTYGFSVSSSAAFGQSILLPVSKGDVFKVDYTATGTTNYFRFIYAQGEV